MCTQSCSTVSPCSQCHLASGQQRRRLADCEEDGQAEAQRQRRRDEQHGLEVGKPLGPARQKAVF